MESNATLTAQGRKTRAEYLRDWRKRNRDKCREYSNRYWSKRGTQQAEQDHKEGSIENDE